MAIAPEFERLLNVMNQRIANRRPGIIESGMLDGRQGLYPNAGGPGGPATSAVPGALGAAAGGQTAPDMTAAGLVGTADSGPGTTPGGPPGGPGPKEVARLTKRENKLKKRGAALPGIYAKRLQRAEGRTEKRFDKREAALTKRGKTGAAAKVESREQNVLGQEQARSSSRLTGAEGRITNRINKIRGRLGYS